MKLGMIGLGKMGQGLSERALKGGHEVVGFDASSEARDALIKLGGVGTASLNELVSQLPSPRTIWVMVPAGEAVESTLLGDDGLIHSLESGDIVIDGGNSRFSDSVRRAKQLAEKGITLLDAGTSGGVTGRAGGYCLMVGGPETAAVSAQPIFEAIAQPGGYMYVGPSGSGHYVKMVHNAIEYGFMESLAEGLSLIRHGDYPATDLAALTEVWQHGSIIQSYLLGLAHNIFVENPTLEGIDGYVSATGEAAWTLEAAKEKGLSLPSVELALKVRTDSQAGKTSTVTKILAALRNQFGGHKLNR
jgi:6-phosphogluconate dehydrogenase